MNGPGKFTFNWRATSSLLVSIEQDGQKIMQSVSLGPGSKQTTLVIPFGAATQVRWIAEGPLSGTPRLEIHGVKWEPTTLRGMYDEWAATLPEGRRLPGDDGNEDGISNLLEYGLALKRAGHPPVLKMIQATRTGRDGRLLPVNGDGSLQGPYGLAVPADCIGFFDLMVPYASPGVTAVLETSADLVVWETWPVPQRHGRPADSELATWDGWPKHTDTHHAVSVPVAPADGARYFRIKLGLPGN